MQHSVDALIITSGDISDADGFIALARYARTGADCMFVMNFPSYVHVPDDGGVPPSDYEAKNHGLGYRFSARDLLGIPADAWDCGDKCRYDAFVARYLDGRESFGAAMKRMLSELAATVAQAVWDDAQAGLTARGRLYYCVGGVNDVSPFSLHSIKNDLRVYAPLLPDAPRLPRCGSEEDAVFACAGDGSAPVRKGCVDDFPFSTYRRIVMDMNGSAAFVKGEAWQAAVRCQAFRLQALFMMGGVRTDAELQTMAAIPGVLNRLAGATTNQLYSPAGTKALLDVCAAKGACVYVVPNNAVEAVTPSKVKEEKVEAMLRFLEANGLGACDYLARVARLYYVHGAPKPFDFYVAEAVAYHLAACDGTGGPPYQLRVLSYNSQYGLTLLSRKDADGTKAVKDQYVKILSQSRSVMSEAIRRADADAVAAMDFDYSNWVAMLEFDYNAATMKLTFPREA